MEPMNAEARRALLTIRTCVAADRIQVLPHFRQRMGERGLVWPDVLAILDDPHAVRGQGRDRYERPKWLVSGDAADGEPIEIVCVLDENERGEITVFITIY
jgi:hypothetical protein